MPRPKIPTEERKRRRIERLVTSMIDCLLDGNENKEGRTLLDIENTPARVARMLVDETIAYPARPILHTTKIKPGEGDILAIGPIGVSSVCGHHILPFTGSVWIAYLADTKLLGLSKFSRVVRYCSQRLQLQERLTHQVRDELVAVLEPYALLVVMRCEHGCISCRGVHEPGMMTVTSALYPSDDTVEARIVSELYAAIDRC